MTTPTPIISVIMPVFNVADYVAQALDSILAQQNAPEFEVLIIDDHSSDDTLTIVKRYAEQDTRIKILTNSRNKGVAGARNTGFDHAQGGWIGFLDGDDTWEPTNLASLYGALNSYPDTNIIISDRYEIIPGQEKELISETDPVWQKYFRDANRKSELLRLDDPARIFFEEAILMRTGNCLIKRQLIDKVGYCDEGLKAGVDMSWFLKLAANVAYIVYVPEPLMNYLHRPGSLTRTIPFGFFGVVAYKKMLPIPEFAPYRQAIKKQIALWSFDTAFYYRKNHHKLDAIRASFEAVFNDPGKFEYWKALIASLLLR